MTASPEKASSATEILIGGDLCPIGKNLPYFVSGDAECIFGELLSDFRKADLSIVNLECPLIAGSSPIKKNGPVLGAPGECINGVRSAGISVLNLANNHIMDHGPGGLSNTLRLCAESGISTVGAGGSLEEAKRPLIRNVGKLRLCVMACAEHEFSIARQGYWGANPLDLISITRTINSRRSEFDYLVVLIHGGYEEYPLPSPRLRDLCRFLVELGADAVIVQHTHCPGCVEEYRGSFIVYGQGNLVFDSGPVEDDSWYKGFLVRLTPGGPGGHAIELLPYEQPVGHAGIRRMSGTAERAFMGEMDERSSLLSNGAYVEERWAKFCEKRKDHYLFGFLPGLINNRVLQKINGVLPFIGRCYTEKQLLRIENMIRCESHREVVETLLEGMRREPGVEGLPGNSGAGPGERLEEQR